MVLTLRREQYSIIVSCSLWVKHVWLYFVVLLLRHPPHVFFFIDILIFIIESIGTIFMFGNWFLSILYSNISVFTEKINIMYYLFKTSNKYSFIFKTDYFITFTFHTRFTPIDIYFMKLPLTIINSCTCLPSPFLFRICKRPFSLGRGQNTLNYGSFFVVTLGHIIQ